MLQNIMVGAIVLLAAVWLVRRFLRKGGGCGCASASDCCGGSSGCGCSGGSSIGDMRKTGGCGCGK